jgi:uncharacterized phage protein (TIGR01671 family)
MENQIIEEYRAWDIRNSKMVENALQLSETGQLVTVNADYFNSPFSFFDGCKWMRCTGLIDRTGKKIFDGDILNVYSFDKIYRRVFVYYNSNAAMYQVKCVIDDEKIDINWLFHLVTMEYRQVEVIGNIYKNPELLK